MNHINDFLAKFNTYICFLSSFSHDWSKLSHLEYGGFLAVFKEGKDSLETFTKSKSNDFFEWFVDLFNQFAILRPPKQLHDDVLALKVLVLVNSFTDVNFKCRIGTFSEEQRDSMRHTLKIISNSKPSDFHKKLEKINPLMFTDFEENKIFIERLIGKIARYKHHLQILDIHRKQKTTPNSLSFRKFSPPFFGDDTDFINQYNQLIEKFQHDVMFLIEKTLNFRIVQANSKLKDIKQNFLLTSDPLSIIEKFNELEEMTAKNLAPTFDFSVKKAKRCFNNSFNEMPCSTNHQFKAVENNCLEKTASYYNVYEVPIQPSISRHQRRLCVQKHKQKKNHYYPYRRNFE